MLEHAPPHRWGVLNDEVVIIHSSGSVGELKVFEPYTGIRFPGVFGDVGRRSEALWERRFLDATAKGLRSVRAVRAVRAGTPVVRSATMLGVRFPAPIDGPARAHVACPHHRPIDIIIMPGLMPVADDVASVLVRTKLFAYRWSVWSRH